MSAGQFSYSYLGSAKVPVPQHTMKALRYTHQVLHFCGYVIPKEDAYLPVGDELSWIHPKNFSEAALPFVSERKRDVLRDALEQFVAQHELHWDIRRDLASVAAR